MKVQNQWIIWTNYRYSSKETVLVAVVDWIPLFAFFFSASRFSFYYPTCLLLLEVQSSIFSPSFFTCNWWKFDVCAAFPVLLLSHILIFKLYNNALSFLRVFFPIKNIVEVLLLYQQWCTLDLFPMSIYLNCHITGNQFPWLKHL